MPASIDAGAAQPGISVRLLVAAVDLYKAIISPWLPRACRFTPTCSQYAREALLRHGPWRGGWLALRRLGRCHPFHPGGHDPLV